ncbi:MAG: helicase [Betaproteobacteria bacterium]|nr:helicase [Betaproteobacteria bacterium]
MPNPVVRANPSEISTTVKEAVVDALVNMTHAQVSGAGEFGKYLFGARPRTLLNSGFLLPELQAEGGDEVTSPIWISSHGLQIQIAAGVSSEILVQPQVSLYVRVLPKEEDLARPNCLPTFRLRPDVAAELKEIRKVREDQEWEKVKGEYTSRFKHPEWRRIREQIREEIYKAKGIPKNLVTLDSEEPREVSGESEKSESAPEGLAVQAAAEVIAQDAHFEPLAVPHKWLRLDIPLPELRLDPSKGSPAIELAAAGHAALMNKAIADFLAAWANCPDPDHGGKLWAYRSQIMVRPSQYKRWPEFLEQARKSANPIALPNVELAWDLELAPDWLDTKKANILVALENKGKEPLQHKDETEYAVFLVSVTATLQTSLHRFLKLERVQPSYRYNRYLQYPAMGHNGGVDVASRTPASISLKTTWAPRFVQPRIVPRASGGIVRSARKLSQPEGLEGVLPIATEMRQWLAEQPKRVNPADGLDSSDIPGIEREIGKFNDDLQKWGNELASIKGGVAILKESMAAWSGRGPQPNPLACVFEAWLGMNEAMSNFMKTRFGNDDGEWRLFQLAFIIANIPALASRMPEFKHHYNAARDDSVTLLYFATGGGKSEAFFGLLMFNLLLDRLRGKKTGVTAMLRYPLRLLTIQQAQRCALVLAQAELVRRANGYGGDAFSIGFWVGSGGSPNRLNAKGVSSIKEIDDVATDTESELKLREDDLKYSAAVRAWNKVPHCPFCGTLTALRLFPKQGGTLAHVCTKINCASNEGTWKPLPFLICDEDIYDLAPSVLLGTVDKLALIGHSAGTIRRVYGMLGTAPWRDAATKRLRIPSIKDLDRGATACGCEVLYPAYPSGEKLFFDPFPSLLVQDEAHLLDESLGTFAGLFESTLDAVFAHLSRSLVDIIAKDLMGRRRRAKVIAASATVSAPERQLEHLYQREIPASQFPHPGPSLYESFYAGPEEPDPSEVERLKLNEPEQRAKQARVYCAFMTNGKPHTATSVAVLSSFHFCITHLFDGLLSGGNAENERIRTTLVNCVSPGPLQQLHRNALLSASTGELVTVIDLHRIALTYVTNKKGGDQIMAAESEETRKKHLNAGINLENLDTRLITGSVEQGEIQEVVRLAQERDEPGQPFTPLSKVLRSVIATSAISHGVDVEEFNSMFFAGMPSDIAEYIQASSRVGRTHIGFVVLVPTPQRRRDRYIVEVFDIFHRFLERMVQPAAIDRWAEKAVERVFPSLFQAFLTGVVPSRRLIELEEDKKKAVPDFTFIPNITKEFTERGTAFVNEITSFIELAIGLKDGYCPEGADHYRKMIDDTTRMFLSTWASSKLYGNGPLDAYFKAQNDPMRKPMTSLRDVDQGGLIQMSNRDPNGRRQKAGEVLEVMDLVRHGVAETNDDEA